MSKLKRKRKCTNGYKAKRMKGTTFILLRIPKVQIPRMQIARDGCARKDGCGKIRGETDHVAQLDKSGKEVAGDALFMFADCVQLAVFLLDGDGERGRRKLCAEWTRAIV